MLRPLLTMFTWIGLLLVLVRPVYSEFLLEGYAHWGVYERAQTHLTLSHTSHNFTIEFPNVYMGNWSIEDYSIGDRKLYIKLKIGGKNVQVLSFGKNVYLTFESGYSIDKVVINHKLIDYGYKGLFFTYTGQNLKQIININQQQHQNNLIYDTNFTAFMLTTYQTNTHIMSFDRTLDIVKYITMEHNKRMTSFLTANSIIISSSIFEITHRAFIRTFSQLCVMHTKFDTYYGLCSDRHIAKGNTTTIYYIDIRYSPLIIDLLFAFDEYIALWLFVNLFSYLEYIIMYRDLEFVEIPEHIYVTRTYLTLLKKHSNTFIQSPDKLRQISFLNNKIIAVLNGLVNQMLLSSVNSLYKYLNYRYANKIHPTILKMLTLSWKSRSLKNSISSIYEYSFMPDYYYNSDHQTLDSAVSKNVWLLKTIDELHIFINVVGSMDDRLAMSQISYLERLLLNFIQDDVRAREGKYYSVVKNYNNLRFYANQIGYYNMLPYVYDITNTFPTYIVKNLTTKSGIASLNLDHPKANSHYSFRGNINLYFNYKLLKKMYKKLPNKPEQPLIVDIIQKIKTNILDIWQKYNQFYTAWNATGTGVENKELLTILNCMFFVEPKTQTKTY